MWRGLRGELVWVWEWEEEGKAGGRVFDTIFFIVGLGLKGGGVGCGM